MAMHAHQGVHGFHPHGHDHEHHDLGAAHHTHVIHGESHATAALKRQQQHSKELINAFKPILYFLTVIGQMPFTIKPKKDGTYSVKFYKISFAACIYFIMFGISTGLYLTVTVGILSFILDGIFTYIQPTSMTVEWNKETRMNETLLWERYRIRHEMVAIIVVWSWLTVSCAGSLYIVTNSKYYVHYMNYFNRVVQIMDMDMTPGVSAYLLFNNLLSLSVAGVLTIAYICGFFTEFHAVVNTSEVIANFMLRLFNIELNTFTDTRVWFSVLGYFTMLYALFASRANVIQFLFFSQLLKNGSRIWNERLKRILNNSQHPVDPHEGDNQFNRRLESKLIYKDHLMLVQLYQMTENVFGSILFAYYSLTMISIVMELYQLAALQGYGIEDEEENATALTLMRTTTESPDLLRYEEKALDKERDETLGVAGISLLLLAQNVFFCYRTTVDAAKAYEDAMQGYEILRRHGLMYCQNRTDRNFVLSLYFSFAKNNPLQLTAGGYFAVNKVLLVTMCSTIINWAISIYQTKVDQWK